MGLYIGNGITIDGAVNIQFEYAKAPTNVDIPVVTGNVVRGNTLLTTTGNWIGVPNDFIYTYQWQRNNSNVSGATTSSYVLGNADVGQTIRSSVMATTATGSNIAYSLNSIILPELSTAPRNVVATSFNSTTARVTWDAPIDNGGGTILGYLITATRQDVPGTVTTTVAGPLSGNITGLVTGGLYRITVQVVNASGAGAVGTAGIDIYIIPAIGEFYGGGYVIEAYNNSAVIASPHPAGTGSPRTWSNANSFCNALILNGYTDWVMPSRTNMVSMANNASKIGGYSSGEHWTNTAVPGFPAGYYYTVTMPTGTVTARDGTETHYVRAVRTAFYP